MQPHSLTTVFLHPRVIWHLKYKSKSIKREDVADRTRYRWEQDSSASSLSLPLHLHSFLHSYPSELMIKKPMSPGQSKPLKTPPDHYEGQGHLTLVHEPLSLHSQTSSFL